MIKFFIVFSFFLFISSLFSHPVTWRGGTAFTFESSFLEKHLKLNYTLNRHTALGLHLLDFKHNTNLFLLSNNWLLKRWFFSESQANSYVFLGLGSTYDSSVKDYAKHVGLQFDWENKQIYSMLKYDYFVSDTYQFSSKYRLGFAPYQASFTQWHTWLILQYSVSKNRAGYHNQLMPVLRLFKKNMLYEIGGYQKDVFQTTVMYHF
eukprot:COSAG01_NODE_52_length_31456_cov_125.226648_17_plen_206_part_00